MPRPWSVAALWAESADAHHPVWRCQVIRGAREGGAVVIDLVALEDCPSDTLGCPRHTPFSLHIGSGDLDDRRWHRTVRRWADAADQVTIVCGVTTDGASWMCLTSADRHLVLQL